MAQIQGYSLYLGIWDNLGRDRTSLEEVDGPAVGQLGRALRRRGRKAVAVGAPAASSAATLSVATTTVGQSLLVKILALGGGAALGAAGGLVGVLFGTRQLKRGARSVSELRSLKRFERSATALILSTAVAFPLSWQLTEQAWSQVATFAGFTAGLVVLYAIWLPRILRSRWELEASENPERAAQARAKERRAAILGWTLGLTCGTLGLIAGILLAN